MTIVVGYIPTPEGQAALAAAIAEATLRNEPVHVINVGGSDTLKDRRYVSEPQADELKTRLERAGIEYDIMQFQRGKDAAEEIVETAEKLNASVIVIGLRRRTPTGKMVFGSQAQRILLDADCPVLAVKATD